MADQAFESAAAKNDAPKPKGMLGDGIGYFEQPVDLQSLIKANSTTDSANLTNLTIQDRAAKDVTENKSPYERNDKLKALFESVDKRLSGTANVSQLLRESGTEVTSTALAKELKANLDKLAEGDDWSKQEFKGDEGKKALFKLLESQDNGAVVLARRLANPDETGIRWASEGNKKYKSHFILDGPKQNVFHTINRPDEPSVAGKWSSEQMEKAIGFYDEFIIYSPTKGSTSPERTEKKQ